MADITASDSNSLGVDSSPRIPEEGFEAKGAEYEDEEGCPSQAPPWMATFSDLGTLLMAFFVLREISIQGMSGDMLSKFHSPMNNCVGLSFVVTMG